MALASGLSPELCPLPAGQGGSQGWLSLSHTGRDSSCVGTGLQGPRGSGSVRGAQPPLPPQQLWSVRGSSGAGGSTRGRWQHLGEVPARLVSTASPSSAGPWLREALTGRSCLAADAAADHGSLHLPRQLPEPGRRLLAVPHPADRGRQSQRAPGHSHRAGVR